MKIWEVGLFAPNFKVFHISFQKATGATDNALLSTKEKFLRILNVEKGKIKGYTDEAGQRNSYEIQTPFM